MSDRLHEGFSAPGNKILIRQLIRRSLPHDIHDYALDGVCHALDGIHVLDVVKTGGGKTTYISGYVIALQELAKLPETHPLKTSPLRKMPPNPLTIVVFPTKGLQVEMEQTLRALNISALAINEDTLRAAGQQNQNLWNTAASPTISCLLLSPEQLASKNFSTFLTNKIVFSRIVALKVDEIHLILSWGGPRFRVAFRDIGTVLHRLPRHTTFTGLTATLAAGEEVPKLMRILGLKPGSFVFHRRSNRRPELQFIFRTLRHGLQGWVFQDLDWVLDGKRKTIIYCPSISLAFRIFVYLWRKSMPSDSPTRRKRFRLYCSLYSDCYNKNSRDLFIQNGDCQFLICTDALKVGNDFPNVDDVITMEPEDPEDILQKGGRAGRKGVPARCINYFTQNTMDKAKDYLSQAAPNGKAGAKDSDDNQRSRMTATMARLLRSQCILAELDIIFNNPTMDPPCYCETCLQKPHPSTPSPCNCSRCLPETPLPPLTRETKNNRSDENYIPPAKRVNEKQRNYGLKVLQQFRYNIWKSRKSTNLGLRYLPPATLLPDSTIKSLFNNFANLTTTQSLAPYINSFLEGSETQLLVELQSLRRKFVRIDLDLPIELSEEDNGSLRLPTSNVTSYADFWEKNSSTASTSTPRKRSNPDEGQSASEKPSVCTVLRSNAGNGNIRPRPSKKTKTDLPGTFSDSRPKTISTERDAPVRLVIRIPPRSSVASSSKSTPKVGRVVEKRKLEETPDIPKHPKRIKLGRQTMKQQQTSGGNKENRSIL